MKNIIYVYCSVIIAAILLASGCTQEGGGGVAVVGDSSTVTTMESPTVIAEESPAVVRPRRVRYAMRPVQDSAPADVEADMSPGGMDDGYAGTEGLPGFLVDLGFSSVGIRSGVHNSKVSSQSASGYSPLYGVSADMRLMRIDEVGILLETNVNYLQRNFEMKEGSIRSEYLNVPFIGKAVWKPGFGGYMSQVSLYTGIGIDFNYRLSSYYHYNADNADYRYDTPPWDVAGVASIGGMMSMGQWGALVGELRYSYGLTPATKEQNLYFGNYGYEDITIKEETANSLMITIGWHVDMARWF